jgi:hypothetical protein
MGRHCVILIMFSLLSCCFSYVQVTRLSSDSDAAQIYTTFLLSRGKQTVMVVSTTVAPMCIPTDSEMPDKDFRAALNDFRRVSLEKKEISVGLPSGNELIRDNEVDSFFKSGIIEGWKQFRAAHPKSPAYLRLSAVGFNPNHDVAIVYSEIHCGPKCGTGGFQYFRREHGRWGRLKEDIPNCRWIS